MAEESHTAMAELQAQLEEYKDRSRKEITDSQKQAKDRNAEVEKMQYNLGRLQDEVTWPGLRHVTGCVFGENWEWGQATSLRLSMTGGQIQPCLQLL